MAYLYKTYLPDNLPLAKALQRIYGIGKHRALLCQEKLGVSSKQQLQTLRSDKQDKLQTLLDSYLIGDELYIILQADLSRLSKIGAYRGLRHSRRLPARGQRTRSNSKTCKKRK